MLVAVDLGSNSFRLHIGYHNGDAIRVTQSIRDPIRLAAGLDESGNLSETAIRSALDCLKRFREIIQANPIDEVRVVATNTFRIAKNIADFLPLAENAIGYPIDIISGEEEGRLIYLGVSNALSSEIEPRLVIDIGGGSTEMILGQGNEIFKLESLSVGTVKHSNTFFSNGQLTQANFNAAILSVRSLLEDVSPEYQVQHWTSAHGSSGTIRVISDAIVKNDFGDGLITLEQLIALKEYCIEIGDMSKLSLHGIRTERVAMVVGGLAILLGIFYELKIQVLSPIEAGLRMGVMWDLYLRSNKADRRDQAINNFNNLFHIEVARANRVAEMVNVFYEALKPASSNLVKYLNWSARLHEVGKIISHTGYHKHSSYIVENIDMPGFTSREQKLMSKLVLGQKGSLKKIESDLSDLDFSKAVLALRLSVMFMHSRVIFDPQDISLKMKNKIEFEIRKRCLELYPTIDFLLKKEKDCWREVGVDFVIFDKNESQ